MTRRRFRAPTIGPAVKSKVEARWLVEGPDALAAEYNQPVVWTMYEPFKLKIGTAWYRIDFAHLLQDGRLILVETKANQYQPNYRDSMTRVKVAQGIFFFFDFVVALPQPKRAGTGWEIKHLVSQDPATKENPS